MVSTSMRSTSNLNELPPEVVAIDWLTEDLFVNDALPPQVSCGDSEQQAIAHRFHKIFQGGAEHLKSRERKGVSWASGTAFDDLGMKKQSQCDPTHGRNAAPLQVDRGVHLSSGANQNAVKLAAHWRAATALQEAVEIDVPRCAGMVLQEVLQEYPAPDCTSVDDCAKQPHPAVGAKKGVTSPHAFDMSSEPVSRCTRLSMCMKNGKGLGDDFVQRTLRLHRCKIFMQPGDRNDCPPVPKPRSLDGCISSMQQSDRNDRQVPTASKSLGFDVKTFQQDSTPGKRRHSRYGTTRWAVESKLFTVDEEASHSAGPHTI